MVNFKIFLILLNGYPLLTDKCKEVTVALFQSNVLNESKVLRNTILVRFQFTKPLQGNWILFVFYHFEKFIDTRFRHKLLTYICQCQNIHSRSTIRGVPCIDFLDRKSETAKCFVFEFDYYEMYACIR